VGARHVVPLQPPEQPANRALQVLFMATSPLGVKPELQFEAEEGRILEATARQPLALVVEESGCLTELGYLIDDYGQGYFDVLHLTGHATITEAGEPRFYTETETGELYLASAADIARSLKSRLPKLIFLSGCRTGQGGNAGAMPSLAEGLLKLGAKAVLGWGQTVLDTDATAAAAALYGALAAGYEVTEALSGTYQELIRQQARDWHLLRLYVGRALPGQLVTPLRTRGRKPAPKPSVAEQFLDIDTRQVKVASRGSFVGRRRQLQNCLRALRGVAPLTPQLWGGQEAGQNLTPPRIGGQGGQCLGVLIHGMGGLGKSTLAARLCDRLPEFERIVWVGRVDEGSLVKRLSEKLPKELRQVLQSYDDELKFRLRDVFEVLEEGADLEKKCNRLSAFGVNSPVDEALREKALRLADGNPRLLEWLDKVLLNLDPPQPRLKREEKNTVAEILARLETNPVELREKVLAKSLLEQIDKTLAEILRRGLVYELPVPREAIVAVCAEIPNLEPQMNRAVALGLLEVSPDASLRVPCILPLKLPEDAETLYRQAAEVLYHLWLEQTKAITVFHLQEARQLALQANEEFLADEIHRKWIEYYKTLPSYGRLDFTNPLNSMYLDF
ncbi:MAG TPA: CHAT domain-containing protein, partial [Allocoleopsis sp.]